MVRNASRAALAKINLLFAPSKCVNLRRNFRHWRVSTILILSN